MFFRRSNLLSKEKETILLLFLTENWNPNEEISVDVTLWRKKNV